MPKRVCLLAAALMLVNAAATAHSWYSEQCCHDKDCPRNRKNQRRLAVARQGDQTTPLFSARLIARVAR